MNTTFVVVQLPDGSAAAFPLPAVAEARRKAQELGFAAPSSPISAPATPPMAGQWVTVERLAAISGLRPAHIRAQARAGLLPSRKVGRKTLLPADALSIGATAGAAVTGRGLTS